MWNVKKSLSDLIIEKELPTLDAIMGYMANTIQSEMIGLTYSIIDNYYQDYSSDEGRVYIRTDEFKMNYKRPRDKKGKFVNNTKNDRRSDKSLMSAIKSFKASGQPAIGVCRPTDKGFGYQAGVLFDEKILERRMKHSVKGSNFTEWDIVENFLYGIHGADDVYVTTPPLDFVLDNYIYSYGTKFYKHYNDACKKFKI